MTSLMALYISVILSFSQRIDLRIFVLSLRLS